jgi:hypothetical protein
MKTTSPDDFLTIGGNIRYLMNVDKDYRLEGEQFIIEVLESLKKQLKNLGFEVSVNLFDFHLGDFLKTFKKMVEEEDIKPVFFPEDKVSEFTKAVKAFEDTVYSEVLTKRIAIPVKRLFSLSDLLDHPENLVGKQFFLLLPKIAQFDFIEACKCLVIELPTAAAFHSLRSVEESVRLLYKAYFRTKLIEKKAWGTLTDELKNKTTKPQPNENILSQLEFTFSFPTEINTGFF